MAEILGLGGSPASPSLSSLRPPPQAPQAGGVHEGAPHGLWLHSSNQAQLSLHTAQGGVLDSDPSHASVACPMGTPTWMRHLSTRHS